MRGDRRVGGVLEGGIEGGVDAQPALADRVHPVALDQLVLDVVEEVLLVALLVLPPTLQAEPLGLDLVRLRLGDVVLLRHRVEDRVAALGGALGVEEGVVVGWRLREAGEQRLLLQADLLDRLVEEDLGGGLDADRGAAVVGAVGGGVQVLLEDLLLRVLLLVLLRHLRLDDLALDRVLGILDVEVADQLLGDRRGALLDLAGLGVLDTADAPSSVSPSTVVVMSPPPRPVGGRPLAGAGPSQWPGRRARTCRQRGSRSRTRWPAAAASASSRPQATERPRRSPPGRCENGGAASRHSGACDVSGDAFACRLRSRRSAEGREAPASAETRSSDEFSRSGVRQLSRRRTR